MGNKIAIDGKNVLNQPGLIDNNWTMPADIKALMEQDANQWVPDHVKPFLAPGGRNQWVPDCKAVPGQAKVMYQGKANRFYQFSIFSPELNCQLFWDAQTLTFFRYSETDDCYLPVNWATLPMAQPLPPPMPEVVPQPMPQPMPEVVD